MIEIKITADTAEEARQLMAVLLGGVAVGTIVPAAQPASPPPPPAQTATRTAAQQKAADKAAAEAAAAAAKAAEAKPDPTPAADATPAADPASTAAQPSEADSSGSATTAELDYDKDVVPLVLAISQQKGRDGVLGLLGKFGAQNAKDVAKDRWPELVADAKTLLGV